MAGIFSVSRNIISLKQLFFGELLDALQRSCELLLVCEPLPVSLSLLACELQLDALQRSCELASLQLYELLLVSLRVA